MFDSKLARVASFERVHLFLNKFNPSPYDQARHYSRLWQRTLYFSAPSVLQLMLGAVK